MKDKIVEFLRKKDFVFVRELGQGACGRTVLLHDQVIDEQFVCKKFSPIQEPLKQDLFKNFVREIKLLHILNHPNIVRVFNYYLYPDRTTGYILMELVKGLDIEEYLTSHPEEINQIFLQTVDGFTHLEKHEILHRDIRPQNILISHEGSVKIIDFGFGKQIEAEEDFDKSISLNWWCELPLEFATRTYDYTTEVYFIGKLFERIIHEAGIEEFSYHALLGRMCQKNPVNRVSSFSAIRQDILAGQIDEIPFSYSEREAYRKFAENLSAAISKIEQNTKYFSDPLDIERKLDAAHRTVMLEKYVPSNAPVLACFLNGAYYYSNKQFIEVQNLKNFLQLLKSCSREKKDIVVNNIFTRLNTTTRYQPSTPFDDDIPF